MFTIPRKLVRTLRAVFRKANAKAAVREPVVVFRTAGTGGLVQFHNGLVSIQYHAGDAIQTDCPTADVFAIPFTALADFEGSGTDVVTLRAANKSVVAEWTDAGVPQVRSYEPAPSAGLPMLDEPVKLSPLDENAFDRLAEVVKTCANDTSRFALNCVQLRGAKGQVVATDGRQLLLTSGWSFPWAEDVLIQRTALFGSKEFRDASLAVGRTDKHIVFAAGDWRLWLRISDGRFPDVDAHVKKPDPIKSRVELAPDDAQFLTKALTRLPGKDAEDAPITLDCNGEVIVRAKDPDTDQATELVLSGSKLVGPPCRINMNRNLLHRAVDLGFAELLLDGEKLPVYCTDASRVFMFATLSGGPALATGTNVTRIASGVATVPVAGPSTKERNQTTMSETKQAARTNVPADEPVRETVGDHVEDTGSAPVDAIEEAEALRSELRAVLSRVSRLCSSIRRQRKQQQLFKSTLASLRQLGNVA